MLSQRVSLLSTHYKLVVNVPHSLGLNRQRNRLFQARLPEQSPISIGISLASLGCGIEVLELNQQDRGLQAVQSAVDAEQVVVILLAAPVIAQHRETLG